MSMHACIGAVVRTPSFHMWKVFKINVKICAFHWISAGW